MVSITPTYDALLQNRYRVVRPLGRGGMGTVYEAFDTRLSRTVALKETLAETDELRRAFERESLLLANLRHPTLPKVLDHFSEGDGLFLVMEYIPGEDLSSMISNGTRFEIDEILTWADQLLDALDYLHTGPSPILHRDIKPANLKLISPTQIILLDFGLAKGAAGQMPADIEKSLLGYSLHYSALEQIQGTGTESRSDLYSLGATLYHLFTGTRPIDAVTRATAVVNRFDDPLPDAKELNSLLPQSISDALKRSMSLDINCRPAAAAEMLSDLHGNKSLTLRPERKLRSNNWIDKSPSFATDDEQETIVSPRRASVKPRWLKGAAIGAAAAAVALLAVVAFFAYMTAQRPITIEAPRTSAEQPIAPISEDGVSTEGPSEPVSIEQPRADQLVARDQLAARNLSYTPQSFLRAVDDGDSSVVELYLTAGMDPNLIGATGRPVIIEAAARGRDGIATSLLRGGADVNSLDSAGATALMEASQRAHKKTVRLLLSGGADVNRTDRDGRTALIRAAAEGHGDIVKLLLERGARRDSKDRQGRDALAWAQMNGHSGVADLLQKSRARH